MKKFYLLKRTLLLVLSIFLAIQVMADEYPKLKPVVKKIKIKVGESRQLPDSLNYFESDDSNPEKVAVSWKVEPDSLGTINDTLLFTAEKAGEGELVVSYDTISHLVELEIEKEDDDDDDFPKLKPVVKEIKLKVGESRQLPDSLNYFESDDSKPKKVAVGWIVEPDSLGTINDTLLFTAEKAGEGELIVSYDTISYSVELEIKKADDDDDVEAPKVKIIPGSARVELGESLELYAFYVDSLRGKTDTTFTWSVIPSELGAFPDNQAPLFEANSLGEGVIIASLGELADTIKVKVYEGKWKDKKDKGGNGNNGNNGKKISITPGDTVVMADAGIIQYTAEYKSPGNSGKNGKNTDISWSVSDTSIAIIDQNGLVTLSGETGLTLVTAMARNFKASVELLVVDPSVDPIVNSITVHRVLPNGKALNPKVFKEGESYKIKGLPYPLNVLNAGMLHFPFGCIDEDITIFMRIPEEYAKLDKDSTGVSFTEQIITGVKFGVQPASSDTIEEPFYFNIPVELSMVFKHGLLDSLGVTPENLDVFFAENAGFIKDGTDNVVVDTVKNKIYASIEHFSTIVVREKSAVTSASTIDMQVESLGVYPNPFSNSTNIEFKLDETSKVDLAIYNMHGQMINQLVNEELQVGTHIFKWNGDDNNGNEVPHGIYFCRFKKNENIGQIQKVILNK